MRDFEQIPFLVGVSDRVRGAFAAEVRPSWRRLNLDSSGASAVELRGSAPFTSTLSLPGLLLPLGTECYQVRGVSAQLN